MPLMNSEKNREINYLKVMVSHIHQSVGLKLEVEKQRKMQKIKAKMVGRTPGEKPFSTSQNNNFQLDMTRSRRIYLQKQRYRASRQRTLPSVRPWKYGSCLKATQK